jgi:hypothetical protein
METMGEKADMARLGDQIRLRAMAHGAQPLL